MTQVICGFSINRGNHNSSVSLVSCAGTDQGGDLALPLTSWVAVASRAPTELLCPSLVRRECTGIMNYTRAGM